ncbi:MAG: GAF domain-containing protein [Bellilinea sp.]
MNNNLDHSAKIERFEFENILGSTLQSILNLTSIASVIGYLAAAYWLTIRNLTTLPTLLLPVLVILLTATFRRDLPLYIRVAILNGYLFLIGALMLLMWGINPVGILILLMAVQGAFYMWGASPGRIMFAVGLSSIILIGLMHYTGYISAIGITPAAVSIPESVLSAVGFILVNIFLAITAGNLMKGFNQIVKTDRELAKTLANERQNLASRIEERTNQLTRQTRLMELAAEIAHQISMESNREQLFNSTIELIRNKLGFYHAGIFLMDDQNEYAVLVSASSEAGQQMLSQKHRLKKAEEGIVGYVVSRGEARIALDVGKDAVHFKNPFLPDTRSEMALPIKTGERILGALDIQSTEAEAFSAVDIQSLQVIANQLAVALDRIRLFEELRQTVESMEASTRTATRKTWRTHLRSTTTNRGYRYISTQKKIETFEPETSRPTPLTEETSRPTPLTEDPSRHTIQIPLRVRSEIIGVLNVRFDSDHAPAETIRMLRTTAERIGQALETARLLEELENRAERERLVTDLSNQVRSSTDLDQILRTTALQLSQSLGMSEVLVQIIPSAEITNTDSPVEVA